MSVAQEEGVPVRTASTVVAQVWRDGARQANLARVLAGIDALSLDRNDARRVGELLGATGNTVLAEPADGMLISDPEDMNRLLEARGVRALVVGV